MQTLWSSSAKATFPLVGSSSEEWEAAARVEPIHLLQMVQQFQYPEEVLGTMNPTGTKTRGSGSRNGK
ncbi:hypothetical protein PF010_g6724 [Phytophthora fragariae]|uniref:Uncharacterized protein n=1 Tax=Phytophthora fragariae TaxID=53985 RepID=A0A6A3UFF8_9STRA|nr:hypothetical protein PF010_g6724 [Phytophthora fragariae]KAE9150338.1 hypothetical protein PF006_g5272 [Phytophthora fragariae]KAE9320858.1 hypothetical protein PF001_g5187 [Phytophthora fragariae]